MKTHWVSAALPCHPPWWRSSGTSPPPPPPSRSRKPPGRSRKTVERDKQVVVVSGSGFRSEWWPKAFVRGQRVVVLGFRTDFLVRHYTLLTHCLVVCAGSKSWAGWGAWTHGWLFLFSFIYSWTSALLWPNCYSSCPCFSSTQMSAHRDWSKAKQTSLDCIFFSAQLDSCWIDNSLRCIVYLPHLVLGGPHALELLLLGRRLVLLHLLFVLLLEELALGSLLQVGDLLELNPVLHTQYGEVFTQPTAWCWCW